MAPAASRPVAGLSTLLGGGRYRGSHSKWNPAGAGGGGKGGGRIRLHYHYKGERGICRRPERAHPERWNTLPHSALCPASLSRIARSIGDALVDPACGRTGAPGESVLCFWALCLVFRRRDRLLESFPRNPGARLLSPGSSKRIYASSSRTCRRRFPAPPPAPILLRR